MTEALPSVVTPDHFSADQKYLLKRAARLEWAEACAQDKDILGWGKALMPDKFYLPYCPQLHGYLIDIRGEEFTDTEAPRNHAKTAVQCNLIPMFQGIYEPEAFSYFLNVQATGTKAQAVNVSMRNEFEANELMRELCGDLIGNDRWTDMQFVLSNNVVYQAISAGQSIRGIMYQNRRPDYLIVDDLYDEDHINNVEATLKMNSWFWGSLYPARARSKRWAIKLQGTAINNYDLLEKLKKQPGVKARTFQAITDWAAKKVLWPELNTFEQVTADIQKMGTVIGMRELQNERRDDTTAIVKRIWLYPKDKPSWEYDPAELKFDSHCQLQAVLLLCDPSIGEKVQNDYTAVVLMIVARYTDGVAAGGNLWYIHDAWMEQLSLDKRVKLLHDAATEQPKDRGITQCRIESIAGFKDFTAEVKRRTNLPVKEIDHVKDKIANLESKSHFFENGKVKINKMLALKLTKDGQNLLDLITYQLTTNYPQHDDLRDGVLLGLDRDTGLWNFVG